MQYKIINVYFVILFLEVLLLFAQAKSIDDPKNSDCKNETCKDSSKPQVRNVIKDIPLWPNNLVYYKIDKVFKEGEKAIIKAAIEAIENVSCIRFTEAKGESKEFINITDNLKFNSGCYSEMGYHGYAQTLNLERTGDCVTLGVIVHNLLHSLGFIHQHNAANRDDYVDIIWDNIKPSAVHNFEKVDQNYATDYGVPYDYDSIMHFNSIEFSKNLLPTIIPKKRNVIIGQRKYLSAGDVKKLNRMYKCNTTN